MSNINLAVKPKVTPKTKKSEVVKPKAKVKAMDPKDYKGTYKYDKDSRIQVCVPKIQSELAAVVGKDLIFTKMV